MWAFIGDTVVGDTVQIMAEPIVEPIVGLNIGSLVGCIVRYNVE